MRIKIPVIGTVIEYNPQTDEVYGDPNDPIRIDVNLGNVSWELISLDVENGLAEIEVTPSQTISEDTGEKDKEGNSIFRVRPTTQKEKETLLNHAETLANELRRDKVSRLDFKLEKK